MSFVFYLRRKPYCCISCNPVSMVVFLQTVFSRAYNSGAKFLYILFFLLVASVGAKGAPVSFTGATGGNWGLASNWSGGALPTLADDVTIPNGKNVVVNVNANCLSLTMAAGINANSITFSGVFTLTVVGSVTISAPTALVTKTITIGAGRLTCASISLPAPGVGATNSITVSTGILTVTGNINLAGTATTSLLTITSSGTLNIGGDITGAGGVTFASTSTVNLNGTGTQYAPFSSTGFTSDAYGNLTISNSTTPVTTNGVNFTVNGVLTINANCILNMGATARLLAVGTTAGTGELQTAVATSAIPAGKNWLFVVNYNGTASQNIVSSTSSSSVTQYSIIKCNNISAAGAIINPAFGTSVNKFIIGDQASNSLLDIACTAYNVPYNFMEIYNFGKLIYRMSGVLGGGAEDIRGSSEIFQAGTTIEYNSNSVQAIVADNNKNFPNVIFSGTGAKTLSGTAPNTKFVIDGYLDISAPLIFANSSGSRYILGDVDINGNFTGNANLNVGSFGNRNINLSGAYLNTFTPVGTIAGTFTYDGTINQNVSLLPTYTTLGVNKLSGTAKLTGATPVSALNVSAGNFSLEGYTLTVSGAAGITNNGSILGAASTSKILFNSSGAQSYSGTGTATVAKLEFTKVAKTNILTINSPFTVTDEFNPILGTLNSSGTTGNLILASVENKTAYVTPITAANAEVTGTVQVQRFMKGNNTNARRGYRLISSPTHVSTTFPLKYNVFNLKQNSYITGSPASATLAASSPTISTLFDYSPNNNPTVYHYREPSAGPMTQFDYYGIGLPLDGNEFNVTEGAYFFYRGLRTDIPLRFRVTLPVEDNILAFKGILNQGTYTTPALSFTNSGSPTADGFNLVGNPYPSTIDLMSGSVTFSAGVSNVINLLDPFTKAFTSINRSNGAVTPGGNASRYIASGQGFFVQVTSVGQTITFNENAKVTNQLVTAPATPGVPILLMSTEGSTVADQKPQYIGLKFSSLTDTTAIDGIVVEFNSAYNDNFNVVEDGSDMGGNGYVFLSSFSKDNYKLAYNSWSPVTKDTKIKLSVISTASGDYSLAAENLSSLDPRFEAKLIDNFKADTIKLSANPVYNFNIDRAVAKTYEDGRFEIVFSEVPVAANTILNFYGKQAAKQVNLGWQVGTVKKKVTYTLEKSINGTSFTSLASVISDNRDVYNETDKSPVLGNNYYRLKQTDVNGQVSYSNVINIKYDTFSLGNKGFKIYPVPARNVMNVQINGEFEGSVRVKLIDFLGRIIKTSVSNEANFSIDLSKFNIGTYIIELADDKNLIGRSTFLKL
ncbi:MAG: T9SS type A sorting domain-containing protein [Flavobacteriales bacterium]|nr:MAG: T9SS type A sorting domain-containing protein [Flavobacteriales bacterium]